MNSIYIKNWGIPIGAFDENDLKNKVDKQVLKKYQKEYPQYRYTNTKIKKINNVRKLVLYICSAEDFRIWNHI